MLWRAFAEQPMDSLTLTYLNMQTCLVEREHEHVEAPSETMRLVYVARGRAEFAYEGGLLSAGEGDMLYWPCQTGYVSVWRGENNQFAVIDIRVADKDGAEISFGEQPSVLFRDEHRVYEGYLSDIEKLNESAYPFAWLERVSLALKLCCEIAREQLRDENADALGRIYTGIAYLEAHFAENFPVDDLARMCAMSAVSFRKLFFECKGMPPVDYRNALRVRRAAQLIRAGASLTETAERVGVQDMKYFSKLFKRFTGVSPSKARN